MGDKSCKSTKALVASFTLAPMCDQFVEIILGALKAVDTSKVLMETDDVSTTVRGEINHVFDVTKAIFLHAATSGKHVAYQATYSMGCPGGLTDDIVLQVDEQPMNEEKTKMIKQYVAAKFSLYPLGGGDYMNIILEQIEAMKKYVTVTPAYSSTRLEGEALDVFFGLESAFKATAESGPGHTVMTVSISANSPSHA